MADRAGERGRKEGRGIRWVKAARMKERGFGWVEGGERGQTGRLTRGGGGSTTRGVTAAAV